VPPTPRHPSDLASDGAARRRATERESVRRRRAIRRQRLLAFGLVGLVAAAVALIVALATGGPAPQRHRAAGTATSQSASVTASPDAKPPPSSFAVGVRVLRLVDTSRAIQLPNGTSQPRTLLTYVRYPALGAPEQTDQRNAPAARSSGPFPLVIFGHGFAVTPALYARMLQSWARAGYIVAAPVFPLENANAAGGPDESDLINQPADMRFVISRMLAASSASSGPFAGLIDPTQIAVAGQSDGGDTALALAYDRYFRDPRVSAAVILSGAEIPSVGGFTFPRGSPPLLATQGTADTVNPPSFTNAFFNLARRPKYLLSLPGAEHLPPYSDQEPQLTIVERVTIAFFDAYLKHRRGALQRLVSLGSVPGVASLLAQP
jgi:predicted dienelactone hydrolase